MDGRAVIFGCHGPVLTLDETRFFRDADPWGFILFARNLENPAQCRALCSDLRDAVGRNAPILIDQEGGRVSRMGAPHWHEWMPALDQTNAISDPELQAEAAYLRARLIAQDLLQAGIDVNCAPVADIAGPQTHAVLRNRCYGETLETVTRLARACADGSFNGGVVPVIKHMPGQGRGRDDSHLALPVIDADLDTLMTQDFAVFHALADLPLGMTGHFLIPALDPEHCTTLSPDIIAMIRRDIGFDGLLMTDDLSMHALGGRYDTRAQRALAAGCDVILHCNGDPVEMVEVMQAVPALTSKAAMRAKVALNLRETPQAFDASLALNRYKSILKESMHA